MDCLCISTMDSLEPRSNCRQYQHDCTTIDPVKISMMVVRKRHFSMTPLFKTQFNDHVMIKCFTFYNMLPLKMYYNKPYTSVATDFYD